MTTRREFLSAAAALGFGLAFRDLLAGTGKSARFPIGVFEGSTRTNRVVEKVCALCKETGLDGFQISNNLADPAVVQTYVDCVKRYGLKVAGACVQFPDKSAEGIARYAQRIDTVAQVAAATGGDAVVMLPSFGEDDDLLDPRGKLIEARRTQLIDALKVLAPHAEKQKVFLSLENRLGADGNKRIIDAVNSPAVNVYLDTYNIEESGHKAPQEIRKLKGFIGQVHIKCNTNTLATSTIPDIPECLQALLDIGYSQWLVFEHYKKPVDEVKPWLIENTRYLKASKLFA